MRILSDSFELLHKFPYRNITPGSRGVAIEDLQILTARATGLPEALGALIVTGDLQGREDRPDGAPGKLLGEVAAEELATLAELKVLPPAETTGVVLVGDFHCDPELRKRGGMGDVVPVWRAFARRFRWVAGVAGNHDSFGKDAGPPMPGPIAQANAQLLDGDCAKLDGLRIGGLGGIMGNPDKPNRKGPPEFLRMLEGMVRSRPDIVLLHQGPDYESGDGTDRRLGSREVRAAVAGAGGMLVACGHAFWKEPLAELPDGPQVLNVDARVVVLLPAR